MVHDDHEAVVPGCKLCQHYAAPRAARPAAGCVHLGARTGNQVGCPSCRGDVRLHVFRCAVHGTCTQGRRVPGVACCDSHCPDRRNA